MHARIALFFLLMTATSANARGQDEKPNLLKIEPQAAIDAAEFRLLPADPDMTEGNAAVVMLRLIWEQTLFMEKVAPTLRDLLKLPHDDPRIIDDFHFDSFQRQLRRAAYMRSAKWEYPIGEEPMATILLPDLQGLRNFGGYGMSLWIGQQIAKNDLPAAREGILIQLACARHMARTPLVINQLVSIAIADSALSKLELLIQQPKSPNLYWALAMLPDALGDDQATVQWEARMLTGSLPSLSEGIPPEGDPAWKQAAAEFSEFMIMAMGQAMSQAEGAALKTRMLEIAGRELVEQQQYTAESLQRMSGEEVVMRWVLAETARVNAEFELAFSLPPTQAMPRLRRLEERIAATLKSTGAPKAPFLEKPLQLYVALHRFDRRVKLLQTAESIRDHAARHDGKLPTSLSELDLPAPDDPLTAKPFEYSVADGAATLNMAIIEGLDSTSQARTAYEISIK